MTAFVLLIKVAFHATRTGQNFEAMISDILLSKVRSASPDDSFPVRVIDTGAIQRIQAPDTHRLITPRDRLYSIVEALALSPHRPAVIGVDVDFSPLPKSQSDDGGYATNDDPDWLAKLKSLQNRSKVLILLGVYRRHAWKDIDRLGSSEFSDMAASIGAPKKGIVRRMVYSVGSLAGGEPCPTMSLAAARRIVHIREFTVPRVLEWALEIAPERRYPGNYRIRDYLVDYSSLNQLRSIYTSRFDTANTLHDSGIASMFENKVVLLGDCTGGSIEDTFEAPGVPEPIPGVYLHACGAYTLIQGPLYELTGIGRALIDLTLALLGFGFIAAIRLHYNRLERKNVNAHRLESFLLTSVSIGSLVAGFVLVRTVRFVWTDFLLVSIVLAGHPKIEQAIEVLYGWTSREWHKILFGKEHDATNGLQ